MKIQEIFKSDKFTKYIIAVGIFGILLLFFSSFEDKTNKVQNKITYDESEYVKNIENQLEEIISHTEGAGKTKLMITLENGIEYKYATEERNSVDESSDIKDHENKSIQKRDSKESNYIVIDGQNGREALIERAIQPKVRGVAVLCEGGDNPIIKNEIIQIVTTVLDISSTKVSVSKIKCE